jgi:predicted Holliday junction resolvase-like endonuclease
MKPWIIACLLFAAGFRIAFAYGQGHPLEGMVFIMLVIIIWLIWYVLTLKKRIEILEKKITATEVRGEKGGKEIARGEEIKAVEMKLIEGEGDQVKEGQ